MCVCVCARDSVCQNHFLFIYFLISVRFHSILLQCCWWDWCLFSDGPIITGLMALEHCSDFTGWQTTLNMNQGDFSMPGTPGLQQAIHLGVCKTQFRGSSAEPIAHACSFLSTCFFFLWTGIIQKCTTCTFCLRRLQLNRDPYFCVQDWFFN